MGTGLNITIDEINFIKVVRIAGRIDATSTPVLDKKINALLDEKQQLILIDFEKVDYLSSAGMRLLLSATKKLKTRGGQLVFCNMSEEVMEIIKMAGFERILTICSTEREALKILEAS